MAKKFNKIKQFKVVIEKDNDGYFVAEVPALPGCHTQAKDLKSLEKRIKEAILLCLELMEIDPDYRKKVMSFGYEPKFVGLETIEV